jgi:hypothetical protein
VAEGLVLDDRARIYARVFRERRAESLVPRHSM